MPDLRAPTRSPRGEERRGRERRRVLVLDADQPAALAIVRSLGRKGLTVDVGERSCGSLSTYSRFVSDTLIYPDPLVDPAGFLDTIGQRLSHARYDLIIPVAEDTVQPLAARRAELEPFTRLAIAPTPALEIMTDKARTFALAETLGVPVPKGERFDRLDALERSLSRLAYPLVLKPTHSIAPENGGLRVKQSVLYAHDADELLRLAKGLLVRGPLVVQEYFRGIGVGVEVLVDRGEVVYAFQHRRLHELPLTGGGSCLRESVPVDPRLLEHAKALMRAVGWHGVAMVEMKLDEASGECRLMEVNGRFWGSLPLAVAAGADFPWMLVELLTRGVRPVARPARTGVVARKLSADVYWYVQVLRPDQDEPLIRWPTRREAMRDLLLAFTPRHRFDVQSLDDVKPGIVDAARTGAWFAERAGSVLKARVARRRAERTRAGGEARARVVKARAILFLCHGNINRSALAEHHLRSLVGERGPPLVLRSAGFHEERGRPADPRMAKIAARAGLDLGKARSSVVDGAQVDAADVIFVMELGQLDRLLALSPAAKEKAFLLSAVTEDKAVPLEIADPYGRDEEAYARCFEEVTRATTAIAHLLGVDDRARPV